MIGDDDWESFFDPDEFGCDLRLVVGGDVLPLNGLRGAPRGPDELRQGTRAQGGVRAKPGEVIVQVASRELPPDWPERRVELDGRAYRAVEAIPIGRLRTGLVLVPYSERTDNHVGWLRD